MENNEIISFLNDDLLSNKALSDRITKETDLIASGILDSLSLVKLVSHLENKFKIEIDDWDVTLENFNTVHAIENYLTSRNAL
jgi:acyl carrier protein